MPVTILLTLEANKVEGINIYFAYMKGGAHN